MENLISKFVKLLTPAINEYNSLLKDSKTIAKKLSQTKANMNNSIKYGQFISVAALCSAFLANSVVLFIISGVSFVSMVTYALIENVQYKKQSRLLRNHLIKSCMLNVVINKSIQKAKSAFNRDISSQTLNSYELIQEYKIKYNMLKLKQSNLEKLGDNADQGELYATELELGLYEEILKTIQEKDIEKNARAVYRLKEIAKQKNKKRLENKKANQAENANKSENTKQDDDENTL